MSDIDELDQFSQFTSAWEGLTVNTSKDQSFTNPSATLGFSSDDELRRTFQKSRNEVKYVEHMKAKEMASKPNAFTAAFRPAPTNKVPVPRTSSDPSGRFPPGRSVLDHVPPSVFHDGQRTRAPLDPHASSGLPASRPVALNPRSRPNPVQGAKGKFPEEVEVDTQPLDEEMQTPVQDMDDSDTDGEAREIPPRPKRKADGAGRPAKTKIRKTSAHGPVEPLPMLARSPDNDDWVVLDSLDEETKGLFTAQNRQMATQAKQKLQKAYRAAINNFNEKDGHEEHACIQCISIRQNRPNCGLKKEIYEACMKCQASKKTTGTPCARMFSCNGHLVLGFLPLPPEKREGKRWGEPGYWIE